MADRIKLKTGPVETYTKVIFRIIRRFSGTRQPPTPTELSVPKPLPDLSNYPSAMKIIIGAADQQFPGWLATDLDTVDITDRQNFIRYWAPGTRLAFLAEHVWEHLTPEQAKQASANCFEFLAPGGRLRLAVPDGMHRSRAYIKYVRPGGTGPGATDHKVLYDYRSLTRQLNEVGFVVQCLEYWDEHKEFHFYEWSPEDGYISRSRRYDERNQNGSLEYTSLIVDGIKPA